MLSSRRLELLLTLEQQRCRRVERVCSARRAELATLGAQRTQLANLMQEYRIAQASFSGPVHQLRHQVRLSDRLLTGIGEIDAMLEGAAQRLKQAEETLRRHQQRSDGWQRQLTEVRILERRQRRRKEQRRAERRWLEGRREQSKI